ncbi:MAG TPA: glycosyltransferase WbuB, partial [Spirochaetia bacterium]|nr:glycosyltransferase WbuB [Spirochaetia bacterium]
MEKSIKGSVLVISERYYPERFLINDLVNQLVLDGADVRVLTQAPSYPEDKLYPGYDNRTTRLIENGVQVTRFKTVLGYKRSLVKKLLNYLSFMLRACIHVLRESRGVDAIFVYHTGPLTQALPLAIV